MQQPKIFKKNDNTGQGLSRERREVFYVGILRRHFHRFGGQFGAFAVQHVA
jgi:hypothetical protein